MVNRVPGVPFLVCGYFDSYESMLSKIPCRLCKRTDLFFFNVGSLQFYAFFAH